LGRGEGTGAIEGTGRAADFEYDCPPELIAQHPLPDRAASRMLVLDRGAGSVAHRQFGDFPSLLRTGDVVVLNVSRVLAARLIGTRENGRPAEVLLVHPDTDGTWLAMVHPGGKLGVGRRVRFREEDGAEAAGTAEAEIVEVVGGGVRRIRFHGMDAHEVMARWGKVPLPPYIRRSPDPEDAERYQTVYARADGSVAAPTAGLHFTPAILDAVRARGAEVAEVTLHVGPGTFKPVEVEDLAHHVMHAEWYEVTPEAAETVNRVRANGGRVWAVGTTATRVLESTASGGRVAAGSGWTSLFIYPPFEFRVVDALLTNFHLPRSTLLMLVAALAGRDATMTAYHEAVRQGYRLYSYGDAMAVVPAG
jgi:S-adenosylmethionine:tRNA ribosyltransferase-isomerase